LPYFVSRDNLVQLPRGGLTTKECPNMTESNEATPREESLRVYEVGYLMLPSIPEEKLPEEVTRLKTIITELGGSVISEEDPELRDLSFEMIKHIGTRNERFNNAYFGWIKFESDPNVAVDLKTKLDLHDSLIRFLIVKTVREDVLAEARREREEAAEAILQKEADDAKAEETAGLDAKIDELVSE
jgi:ribosomal protein S6